MKSSASEPGLKRLNIMKVFLDLFVLKGEGNPKVFLTACTDFSYGQKTMKFVVFILYDFSKQRVTDVLSSS